MGSAQSATLSASDVEALVACTPFSADELLALWRLCKVRTTSMQIELLLLAVLTAMSWAKTK